MQAVTVDGATTRELRRRVLRAHLPPEAPIPGDDRPDAVHVAVLDAAGAPLGACLVFAQPCPWRPERPAWMLRSMAVDPAAQGRGIGRTVLAGAVTVAAGRGAALLWCHARATAEGFWRGQGWTPRLPDDDPGQVYLEPATGLPHLDMWRPVGP